LLFQFPVPVKHFFVNSRRFYLNKCCELKQRFLHVWHNAIDEWHGRLRACVWAKGGHFEQLLWQYSAIMTRDVSVFVKFYTLLDYFFWKLPQFHTSNFRKVVWQHTEVIVGSIIWVFTWLFSSERILKIR